MTKQIKFEGKVHSFPDDATDEEINAALPGFNPEPSLLNKIVNETSGAIHMPLSRSLKNIGQGAIDLAEFATNPAGPAMKFLAKQEIPYISEGAKHWPQYPESDVFSLGEGQPGDSIFQAATPLGPIAKGGQLAGKSLEQVAKLAFSKAAKTANKAGDTLPIFKSIASKPYKNRDAVLEAKNLLTGYKPDIQDILEAQRILTSPGMEIPHEAVNSAVAKAIQGDFKPWFRLQSSVKSEGIKLSKKGGVHGELGEDLYNMGEKMHLDQEAQMASRGAPEAAEYQRQGKARTARYHKISPVAKVATGIAATAALPKWVAQMLKAAGR